MPDDWTLMEGIHFKLLNLQLELYHTTDHNCTQGKVVATGVRRGDRAYFAGQQEITVS